MPTGRHVVKVANTVKTKAKSKPETTSSTHIVLPAVPKSALRDPLDKKQIAYASEYIANGVRWGLPEQLRRMQRSLIVGRVGHLECIGGNVGVGLDMGFKKVASDGTWERPPLQSLYLSVSINGHVLF